MKKASDYDSYRKFLNETVCTVHNSRATIKMKKMFLLSLNNNNRNRNNVLIAIEIQYPEQAEDRF